MNEKCYQNRIDTQFLMKRCFIHFRAENRKNRTNTKKLNEENVVEEDEMKKDVEKKKKTDPLKCWQL